VHWVFHFKGDQFVEKKTTGCKPLPWASWKTAQVAKSGVSVSMTKGLVASGKVRTVALVRAAFRPSKAWCWQRTIGRDYMP
jgi:hypothetical protein